MIQEIVNYIKHLKEKSPMIFEEGLKPSKGLHVLIELDENGNPVNFPGEMGKNWDYYDGKEMSEFIKTISKYDFVSTPISMNKLKKFDPKQKIHSISPFVIAFNFSLNDEDKEGYGISKKPSNEKKDENNKKIKKIKTELVISRMNDFFENIKKIYTLNKDELQYIEKFKNVIFNFLKEINRDDSFPTFQNYWLTLKEKEYVKFYLKNISADRYEELYNDYLKENIFNKDKYNIKSENNVFGVIDYLTTFNDAKIFLKHKTSFFNREISYRYNVEDAFLLNTFNKLKRSKVFPNPLPIFIDESEFKNLDDIIAVYKQDQRLKFSQIIKRIFNDNPERIFRNYYLLFFIGEDLVDFDYVPEFRYWLGENGNYPIVKNTFQLKVSGELIKNKEIKHIFEFEKYVVKTIFNNSLVKINEKTNEITLKYFDDIKLKYVIGGEPVFLMILKYRKAFYDYIYKSKTNSITYYMWDEILWNSIIADLRDDKLEKGYHTREWNIKEKLNIWFSFYNFFGATEGRIDMGSKIQEFIEKTRKVANDENEHLETIEEAMFTAGQIIFYLLNQSKSSEKTHALLEPFLQKSSLQKLQDTITNTFNMYKHEINFGHGRFERLMKEVLGFEHNGNIKYFQRILLAGYFSEPVIYEKKEKKEENNE